MNEAIKTKNYPYISWNPNIADNVPIIEGTRITVRSVAVYYQMGMSVDEILNTITHLSHAQIHSALEYYFDHQDKVDNDIKVSNDIEYWKTQTKDFVLLHNKLIIEKIEHSGIIVS